MNSQTPFLEVRSFLSEEAPTGRDEFEAAGSAPSPFLSIYEAEDGSLVTDPLAAEYAIFLNELYDEEFNEALFELAGEASELYEAAWSPEEGESIGYRVEQMLQQHFAPLIRESEAMFGALAAELGGRDPAILTEAEIDVIAEQIQPSMELSPTFDRFLGALKKAAKRAVKGAAKLAKKGASIAKKLGLGPILNKLKALARPLIKRVVETGIAKLPPEYQDIARKLAKRLPMLKEYEEYEAFDGAGIATSGVAEIQAEFDRQVADLLFATDEVEQEMEVAEVLAEARAPTDYSIAELDRSRAEFEERLRTLQEGEDPTPHVERFLPAILQGARIGIRVIGRKRVVDFLAKYVAKLIQRFVGPKYTPALSRAMVDAGLRLMNMEAAPEDEAGAAASAVAATVEETVRRVASLPDYVLDDQELLEAYTLQAFEQAAAANLPPILSEETYQQRPDLQEARTVRGVWKVMPRGRRRRYKKYSQVLRARVSPHKAEAIESFEGVPLSEFLEEQLGLQPGEDVEAQVHLYEAIPGTMLTDVARSEESTPGLGTRAGYQLFHPLTPEAAGLLLGEPGLGREVDDEFLADPYLSEVGQRFYYLEVPGRRPLAAQEVGARGRMRRPTRVGLTLDFAQNEARIHLYLSEVLAQRLAVKLRQQTHPGMVAARLGRILDRGLQGALVRGSGRLRIVHPSLTPKQWTAALRRLPSFVPRVLSSRLHGWVVKGLAEKLKQQGPQFIAAADEPADGVTLIMTLANVPGLAQVGQALTTKTISLTSLKQAGDEPLVTLRISAGRADD
jgi:hypothetical protein